MIQAIIKLFNKLLNRELIIIITLGFVFAHSNMLENSNFIVRSSLYCVFMYCIVRFIFNLFESSPPPACRENRNTERDYEDIESTAYHEAGHAIVGRLLKARIRELSIEATPKLNRCGHIVYCFPGQTHKKSELLNKIEATLGGMAAEIVIYGESSSGPYEDLCKAKKEALHMIENLGMGKKMIYGKDDPEIFAEANQILENAKIKAIVKLKANIALLHSLKDTLLKNGTLTENEIENFFKSNGI